MRIFHQNRLSLSELFIWYFINEKSWMPKSIRNTSQKRENQSLSLYSMIAAIFFIKGDVIASRSTCEAYRNIVRKVGQTISHVAHPGDSLKAAAATTELRMWDTPRPYLRQPVPVHRGIEFDRLRSEFLRNPSHSNPCGNTAKTY